MLGGVRRQVRTLRFEPTDDTTHDGHGHGYGRSREPRVDFHLEVNARLARDGRLKVVADDYLVGGHGPAVRAIGHRHGRELRDIHLLAFAPRVGAGAELAGRVIE